MRRHPFRLAMADATKPRVSSLQALIGAIALARALKIHWQSQQNVGLLLPPTVAGALTTVAAALAGRTSVNLNYTVGKAGLESAVQQAQLRTIVTSRKFIEKAKLELPDGPTILWLEDIGATIGSPQKALAAALAILAPLRLIESACGQTRRVTMDDLATIIFSSGSTGEPKGVMLSHFSIDANVQAVSQVLPLAGDDRILGILPLFHSFGYLVFWYVTLNGAATVFHPSPLDVTAIGELCAKHRLTFLVCTPTFLQLYQRRCTPEQFSTLRVVLTGAEKLSLRLCQSFQDRFGIAPIEGYGVTECAPVIAVNCPDFRAAGFYQPASRRGGVGQPLPGVSVRIVDPDSDAILPPGTSGMLLVKGPNVMNGYLGREDLTAQAMRDGWYITGDIATLDDDGFLTITDRLSRFSKIGGEMVPHRLVEEALQLASGKMRKSARSPGCRTSARENSWPSCTHSPKSEFLRSWQRPQLPAFPIYFCPPTATASRSRRCPSWERASWISGPSNGSRWNGWEAGRLIRDARGTRDERRATRSAPESQARGEVTDRLPCPSGRATGRRQWLLHLGQDAEEPAVPVSALETWALTG